ncbi:MAG TPA: hypothetical protein VKB53_05365 [Gammaproteobacteria bacterium]|nr:hypothetical protein [Gammaproteobacteria bacterium]
MNHVMLEGDESIIRRFERESLDVCASADARSFREKLLTITASRCGLGCRQARGRSVIKKTFSKGG